MADIKFMDISQNDNPSTTDSILVGNQQNGLKRTTLDKIGEMFSVHGLLHFERANVNMSNTSRQFAINAPDVEGYTFAFWLSSATNGRVLPTYIIDPTNPNTQAYLYNPDNVDVEKGDEWVQNPNIGAIAVYIKSTVA